MHINSNVSSRFKEFLRVAPHSNAFVRLIVVILLANCALNVMPLLVLPFHHTVEDSTKTFPQFHFYNE